MNSHKILGIVGAKNSGKTTLVEALVRELAGRGLKVSTIKHAHHDIEVDVPGKDSYRHRVAGAVEVIVASAGRWALMHELRGTTEPSLDELIGHLSRCDLVLVEGFKEERHEKIEVVRARTEDGLIADRDKTVCAVATDQTSLAGAHYVLPLNQPGIIADFIMTKL